jgi:histidinol-phosphate aminotransferase
VSRDPVDFVRSTIRPLAAYGPPRDPAAVPLHLNEAPYDLPQPLKDSLAQKLARTDWSKYPIVDGAHLAASLAKSYSLEKEQVLVGNGSNELLQLLLFATLEPNDKVVIAAPTFSLYELQARALGARVTKVPLRVGDEYRFPLQQLVDEAQDAKLVLLGSPNNPTGTTLSFEDAALLAATVPGLLGIDEAYRDFGGQDFAPLLRLHPRLVLFRTFSKAMAAASLRVGCMLGAGTLCAELHKIQLPYNLSAPSCLIAEELLQRPELVAERASLIVRERERVASELRRLGMRVHPSGANFLLFEQEKIVARELHAALFRRGVLIRDFAVQNALRVSIGSPEKNDAFLEAMRAEL